MSTGRRVVIHIDELVLRGFRPEDRHAIAEGLQAELARLYAASPDALRTLAGLGSTARLRACLLHAAPAVGRYAPWPPPRWSRPSVWA